MPTTTRRPTAATPPESMSADGLRLDNLRGQARKPALSWIAVGLLVLLAAGLFGAIALARVADRAPVLALAQPIERGEVLTDDHLRVVHVATDDPLALTGAEERGALVGLVAQGRLAAGTLVSPEQFAAGPTLPDGWTVLGLALQPGEYPTSALSPGDRVVVVRTPPPATSSGAGEQSSDVLTEAAEVWAVEVLSETSRSLAVSIAVPEDAAAAITAAAAHGRVRLLLVGAR